MLEFERKDLFWMPMLKLSQQQDYKGPGVGPDGQVCEINPATGRGVAQGQSPELRTSRLSFRVCPRYAIPRTPVELAAMLADNLIRVARP